MDPQKELRTPPEPQPITSVEFDSTSAAHQQALLSIAARQIAEGTSVSLRLAGMTLLDYHQALLREAAHTVGLDASQIGDITPLLNLLRTQIPGMDKKSWAHLTKLRNTIYHNEFRHPTAPALEAVLEGAPKMRRFVLGAASAAVENQKVMSRMVQRLLATALEMRRELPTGRKEWRAPWIPKIDRAIELTKTNPAALTDEGAELLLELTRGVEGSRTTDRLTRAEDGDDYDSGLDYSDFEEGENLQEDKEPDEFDPSEYYPDASDGELADQEPPDEERPGND